MRVGHHLHRFETFRQDFYDSHSNEELRIDEEAHILTFGGEPPTNLDHNIPFTGPQAKPANLATRALPHDPCDQSNKSRCARNREIMNSHPNPSSLLEPALEKADFSLSKHQKESLPISKSTFSKASDNTAVHL